MRIKIATSDNNLETAARYWVPFDVTSYYLLGSCLVNQKVLAYFSSGKNFSVGDKGVAPKRNRNLRRENNEPEFLLETLNCFLCLESAFFPKLHPAGATLAGCLLDTKPHDRKSYVHCLVGCSVVSRLAVTKWGTIWNQNLFREVKEACKKLDHTEQAGWKK